MEVVQTEDRRFVRDLHSKALLNTDRVALENHRNRRNLNCFYSIFAKKRNSQSHFKCIKKHKITPKICCSSAIMLCSTYFELLHVDQYSQDPL